MLLSVGEVAIKLRVDSTTVRRWIRRGCLEAIALPNSGVRVVYRIDDKIVSKIIHGDNKETECIN